MLSGETAYGKYPVEAVTLDLRQRREMALLHHDNVHRLRLSMTACTPLSISAADRR